MVGRLKKTYAFFPLLIIAILFIFSSCKNEKKLIPKLNMKQESLKIFEELQEQLIKELHGAIKMKGVKGAVHHCRLMALTMERAISKKNKVTIRRVSDKPRNTGHAMDAFEKDIFNKWKSKIAKGNEPDIVSMKDKEGNFRVMKAIFLRVDFCLKCHGGSNEIAPNIMKILNRVYPKDEAKDYKVGQLRGAFSAIWKLNKSN